MRSISRFLFALALGCLATQTLAAAYYFTTIGGSPSAGSNDGPSNSAHFSYPLGVAIDPAGNTYVADTGNHTVRKITPSGNVTTLAGKAGEAGWSDGTGAAARFYFPQAVTVAPDGSLYVGDAFTVRRISPDGAVTTLAGMGGEVGLTDEVGPAARFSGNVRALQVEPDGGVLLIDSATLRRLTPERSVTTLATKEAFWVNGNFQAMTRDAAGNLYLVLVGLLTSSNPVSQTRVYRMSPSGSISVVADENTGLAGVTNALAIARNPAGDLFLADNHRSVIIRLPASGGAASVYAGAPGVPGAQDGPALTARFTGPAGLVIDPSGNLLVAENNNTIRRISTAGVVSTVAGTSEEESGRHADGVGRAARFWSPHGVAVGPGGICFVADTANHVIRRVGADGTVTTLAGAPGQPGYADGTATSARFKFPRDISIDAAGNLYVIEASSAVRKITPGGVVSTLAGDGTKTDQALDGPVDGGSIGFTCLAATSAGEVYVLERGVISHPAPAAFFEHVSRIRRIAINGTITTEWTSNDSHFGVSGLAVAPDGAVYFCDGNSYLSVFKLAGGTVQRFFGFPARRVAVGPTGRVFVASYAGDQVAELLPDGNWLVLGGRAGASGDQDGIGTDARFDGAAGIAAGAADALYIPCDNNTIRQGLAAAAPVIVTQPQGLTVAAGNSVQFSVAAAAVPAPAYQWYYNGARISGAVQASYRFTSANAMDAGEYTVVVTNELGSVTSSKAVLAVTAATTPPPPTTGGSGSGNAGSGATGGAGGGAPSIWFLGALAALGVARLQFHGIFGGSK